MQKLGKLDTIFIVDAAHDKAAWFNFGPEADTRIRKMWTQAGGIAGAEKRSVKPELSMTAGDSARHWRHRSPPTFPSPAICSGVKIAHRPRRRAQDHLAVLEALVFRHQRTGAHQRARADPRRG